MSKEKVKINSAAGLIEKPRVGDAIFTVKEVPIEEKSKTTLSKYDVFAETVYESKAPDGEDPRTCESLDIRFTANGGWKNISLISTMGPRKLNELLISEDDALETVRHFTEKERKLAQQYFEDARKAVKLLEQYEEGWNNRESLDFDKPGEIIKLDFEVKS